MTQPTTRNGIPLYVALSALQKCIRRGMEREAMAFAVELMHSNRSFFMAVCTRLEIIAHEDVGLADPAVVPFVRAAVEQARSWYDADPLKQGKARLALGNAIRMMARASKSREGDHFAAAIGLAAELEGAVPEIPDWAYDHHTFEGKRRGRDLDYFRRESAKLVPAPLGPDAYEQEAYRLWALKRRRRPKSVDDDQDDQGRLL